MRRPALPRVARGTRRRQRRRRRFGRQQPRRNSNGQKPPSSSSLTALLYASVAYPIGIQAHGSTAAHSEQQLRPLCQPPLNLHAGPGPTPTTSPTSAKSTSPDILSLSLSRCLCRDQIQPPKMMRQWQPEAKALTRPDPQLFYSLHHVLGFVSS